jgi:hypothetical protein
VREDVDEGLDDDLVEEVTRHLNFLLLGECLVVRVVVGLIGELIKKVCIG